MKVKWLGHACFLVTSDNGVKIITDPYLSGFKGIINYGAVRESPDVVTISHGHGDHNHTGDLQGSPVIIRGAGKHEARGIEFTGIASYHDRVSGRERGENTIFCFSVDGVRVCHGGDLGHPLDDSTLKSLGSVDVLFLPIGGPAATIELNEVIALWEKIQPGVFIPMHFRNQKCTFPKYGAEDLVKLKPAAVRAGKSEVEFAAGRLPKSQILILDPTL